MPKSVKIYLLLAILLALFLIGLSKNKTNDFKIAKPEKETSSLINQVTENQEDEKPLTEESSLPITNQTEQSTSFDSVLNRNLKIFASIPYWDQEQATKSFKENVELIDFISLFWYQLKADGTIAKYSYAKEDQSIIDFAHHHQVKVLALIANLPEERGLDWDWQRVDLVIADSESRKKHIDKIISLIENKNFDGINIDYESLKEEQENDFSQFIAELANRLHQDKKILMVALHPRQTDDHSHGQNWLELSHSVDQLAFMTYDQHWEKSEPGPIASIDWVERILQFAISLGVPREKIFMGIPLYGYDWQKYQNGTYSQGKGLEYEEVVNIIKKYGVNPQFDEKAASAYLEYSRGLENHIVWFENSESFVKKLELARKLDVEGIALWRLGREDEQIWPALEKAD